MWEKNNKYLHFTLISVQSELSFFSDIKQHSIFSKKLLDMAAF